MKIATLDEFKVTIYNISEMNPAKKSKSAIYKCPFTAGNDFCELNFVTPLIQNLSYISSYLNSSNVYRQFFAALLNLCDFYYEWMMRLFSERSENVKSRTELNP